MMRPNFSSIRFSRTDENPGRGRVDPIDQFESLIRDSAELCWILPQFGIYTFWSYMGGARMLGYLWAKFRIHFEVAQRRFRCPLHYHAFADDFNLLRRDPRSHQRILNEALKHLKALRLTPKVSKYVSLGIKSDIFTPCEFIRDGKSVRTADKKDLVILGTHKREYFDSSKEYWRPFGAE